MPLVLNLSICAVHGLSRSLSGTNSFFTENRPLIDGENLKYCR